MENLLNDLAIKHKDWVRIVLSFGADEDVAEDYVQDMYLKIYDWYLRSDKAKSIMYNGDEINYYFVFKTLNSLYITKKRREVKYPKASLEDVQLTDNIDFDKNMFMNEIQEKIDKLYWYDKKIFEFVYKKGMSMLQLSQLTGISYYSIKRTINKVKKILR